MSTDRQHNHRSFVQRNAHGLILLTLSSVLIVHLASLPVSLVFGWITKEYVPFQMSLMSLIFIGPMEVILIGLTMLPFSADSSRTFDMKQMFVLLACAACASAVAAPHLEGMVNEVSFGNARFLVAAHTLYLLTMAFYGIEFQLRQWFQYFKA